MSDLQDAYLYFENGVFIKAKSFGASGESVGEAVFNTSLTGYQEIITDPSYAGQFITFTMSEIGIVGANAQDFESRGAFCSGVIVNNYNEFHSNFRAQGSLSALLKEKNIMGICNVHTRGIVKMLRDQGAMMMIASTLDSESSSLEKKLKSAKRIEEINYIQKVSTKTPYTHTQGVFSFSEFDYERPKLSKKIIALDFGIKRNILNELCAVGLEVEVLPHNTSAESIIARFEKGEIAGVFLSNGPGDPAMLDSEIAQIKKLIGAKIPMFGICLGHQLLSRAQGFETYKLKFGHHGGNHPVKNQNGEVEITAQNHNYSVPESIEQIAHITHRNLFDGTIEGVRYKDFPIFSIQYHPESSPGPKEARVLFKQFADML